MKNEFEEVNIDGVEIVCTDGVFIKQMVCERIHTIVPQHSHAYSHHSLLATGSVRVWRDGKIQGDYHAPTAIFIKANSKHKFMTLEPNTIIYCIHRLHESDAVEIVEEHQLTHKGG